MDFQVIVTIGPSLVNGRLLKQIHQEGSCIFRINGAHVTPEYSKFLIKKIRSIIPDAQIMIDLPGNKVRTCNLDIPIRLRYGELFSIIPEQLNYPKFYADLKKGDIIYANDMRYTFEVERSSETSIDLVSYSDGLLLNNKGFHSQNIHDDIPFMFEIDKQLVAVAAAERVSFLSLSFVRDIDDIREVKSILPQDSGLNIIAKIETKKALENLNGILGEVDNINVDRGDLASDVGLFNVIESQQEIIMKALSVNKDVFLATQFLKSMEESPIPLIAEVAGLHAAVRNNIRGIQLSEETAIGKYPLECVKLVFEMAKKSKTKEIYPA